MLLAMTDSEAIQRPSFHSSMAFSQPFLDCFVAYAPRNDEAERGLFSLSHPSLRLPRRRSSLVIAIAASLALLAMTKLDAAFSSSSHPSLRLPRRRASLVTAIAVLPLFPRHWERQRSNPASSFSR
jgi:hypothetical protein